jgi:hypothetical protein
MHLPQIDYHRSAQKRFILQRIYVHVYSGIIKCVRPTKIYNFYLQNFSIDTFQRKRICICDVM